MTPVSRVSNLGTTRFSKDSMIAIIKFLLKEFFQKLNQETTFSKRFSSLPFRVLHGEEEIPQFGDVSQEPNAVAVFVGRMAKALHGLGDPAGQLAALVEMLGRPDFDVVQNATGDKGQDSNLRGK